MAQGKWWVVFQSSKFASKKPRLVAFVALVTLSLLLVPQPWLSESDRASASGTAIVAGHFATGREATSAVFDGTHAWVFGGKEGGKRLDQIVRYDPVSDQATTIGPKLPGGREATSAVFLDGSAYIIGGRSSGDRVSAILKFTPDGNGGGTISTISAELPTGREFTAAGTDGESIFVFGGTDGTYLNTIVRVDPVSNEVQTMDAKLPTGRIYMSAASAGRFIYLFGGSDGTAQDDVFRYDTKEDQLDAFGSLPSARFDTSAVYAAPFAYVFGGRDVSGARLNDILRYDPLTQTFSELDWSFRTERESTSAVATGDDGKTAIVFGGRNGGHRMDEIVEVSLDAGAPQNLIARTGLEPGEIDLTWEAPADGEFSSPILGYRLYRGNAAGHRVAFEEVAADQLAFTDSGLPNSVIRFYSITAFTIDGEGGHSNEAYAATKRGPPPPLPSPREGVESVWIGGRAFVFGGYQSADAVAAPGADMTLLLSEQEAEEDGEVPLNEIVEYDPDSGTVTVLGTELPPKCCATGESDGENVFLFGGDGGDERCCEGDGDSVVDTAMSLTDPSDTEIYKFDPDTGELTVLGATLPTPVCCTASAFDGNVIWLFGGSEEERCCEDEEGLAPGDPVSDILFFDPETETLEDSGYDLPIPKCCFTAESEGGYIWLFGGSDDADERCCEETLDAATDDDIIRFDPDTGEVVVLGQSLPIPKCCLSSADDDEGTIYLFGGEGDEERCCEEEGTAASAAGLGGVQYDDIYAFDVATQTLRILDDKLPSARADTSAVWNGQRAFIFGGDVDGSSTKEVVGFDPLAPQATTASAGPARGEITVDWKAPADDDQTSIPGALYRVYIRPQGEPETFVEVSVNQTTLVDSGLGDGETRTYRVSVITQNDEGPHSRESSATTFTGPGAPQNLAAEQDLVAGTITLTWDAASDGGAPITQYTIYRHTDLDVEHNAYSAVAGNVTEFVDDGCDFPAVQCFYTVTATNLVGEGPHSNEVSAVGTALPAATGRPGPSVLPWTGPSFLL